ncbi:UDP-2,3-diacylglucosamine diphosphatase [Methanosarcina vacuolata]|uniref:Calcineurin-like phosphoesterase domain-containing protein n=1 Tax=Methanosarcina vacuolata Z-761 TaxID=1434123 RepID=A0A0E3Q681_9EURY|nr:UDP-2,3-diacylglucosamine diphosphatase [Methanosarcina vacuolata]AKB45077.1 hypothetical protein MSVAZ_2808 [Methanosarcina vacuolata Z-761]
MSPETESAYIVVSDVHLGSEQCNQNEFCCFLEWINSLSSQENTDQIVKCKNKEVKIKKPCKIILLGDIVELWDPKDGDRDNVIKDSMRPLSLLTSVGCDKIYVVGNHDYSLGELEGKINWEHLCNETELDIYDSHYPKKDKNGIAHGFNIGNRSYFFLHGHQFDKEQAVLAYVSHLIGELWNPLNWFQVLYNIPFTKKHWKRNFVIFLGLVFGGKYLMWSAFLQSSFWVTAIWAIITGFFAFSSIPGIVAHTQEIIYKHINPLDKTAEEVITDEYYKKKKDTIQADVVVFGHTHFASYYPLDLSEKEGQKKKKLFVNSGCWVGTDEDINGKMRYSNTFIYIDKGGAYIMRWCGSGKIDCIDVV